MRAAPIAAAACGALLLLAACDDDSADANGLGSTSTTKPAPPPDLSTFKPSKANHDPAKAIPGIKIREYAIGLHIQAPQRVGYDQSPPYGGAHDMIWAACNGVVYTKAVRNENMVHTLEHGAVWIAYNPDQVSGDALDTLTAKVTGQTYISISPYPKLDKPVSLQSWGHQLKLDDVNDPRIDEFITALRLNQYTTPELGAPCDATQYFDVDDPPPFDPSPPGPDAMPVNGSSSGPAGGPTSTRTSTR
jgi:Protein of unknown function (DUF3105)